MDSYKIIKFPLSTEKSIRLMEAENKLVFVVDKKATKAEIRDEIKETFKVGVKKINTQISVKGLKKIISAPI